MSKKHLPKIALFIFLLSFCMKIFGQATSTPEIRPNFYEDFETDLSKWDINNPEKIRIIDSKDAQHGKVLEMHVGGPNTFALIKNSENWNGVVVEGDVLFPENAHNYLGFIYNYQVNDIRADYGCIYIKGNSSYVRVNPHRDGHVSRILYDEYRTYLTGKDSIRIGKWQHFKAEVKDNICHFYVSDMKTPKVTFPYFEFSSGKIGFEPRVIGSEVWIDNISVKPINELTYQGFQPKNITYKKEQFLNDWQTIGPFRKRMETIEKDGFLPTKTYAAHLKDYQWKDFTTDARGCVVGGKILEWTSQKTKAYFHTNIASSSAKKATLHFSTTNNLVVWLNGEQVGEIEGKFKAWYDCLDNPKHVGQTLDIPLKAGNNHLMILEQGMGWDGYAGDGFFVSVQKPKPKKIQNLPKYATVEEVMETYYASISGPIGKERNFEVLRNLFHPEARLIYAYEDESTQSSQELMMTLEEFIGKLGYTVEKGFYEKEISSQQEVFGSIAQVFSTYEFWTEDKTIEGRGITSYQLLFDGKRYWIISMIWTPETDKAAIPRQYLNK